MTNAAFPITTLEIDNMTGDARVKKGASALHGALDRSERLTPPRAL